MAELENTFSWSFSRHSTFEECPRKYWFNYYGAWGGWEYDAPAEARELYLLKKISNLHMLAGIGVILYVHFLHQFVGCFKLTIGQCHLKSFTILCKIIHPCFSSHLELETQNCLAIN